MQDKCRISTNINSYTENYSMRLETTYLNSNVYNYILVVLNCEYLNMLKII